MKKAKLTLGDRFAVLSVLPAEGNFATLKMVRKLREQLSLTESEIKEYKVVQISEEQVVAITSAKTDAEALIVATALFGKDSAQRIAIGIRNGTMGGNQITWEKGGKVAEMEFGEFAENMIKNSLEELDKTNKLEDKHFAIYEMFVGGL